MHFKSISFYVANLILLAKSEGDDKYACDKEIFCYGEVLHTVQMKKVFQDSKTFVDMKMKFSPAEIKEKFAAFKKSNIDPSAGEVEDFVKNNFDDVASEFEEKQPVDWTKNPTFLDIIENGATKDFALELHKKWKMLLRQIKPQVEADKEKYSILYVKNPAIVPGGRFREFYYWDTYWIIAGLLVSGMATTVKGILENFILMIEAHGFVPNGGRVYYLGRSQPPLFIPMVREYYMATKDKTFLEKNINSLVKEFDYWIDKHTTKLNNITVARYGPGETKGPRPESYREDYENAGKFDTEKEKEEFYMNIKAAAESGWDFSSRWFITKDGGNDGELTDTKTTNIAPVDLNAFICGNALILSELYKVLGDEANEKKYLTTHLEWKKTLESTFWHSDIGSWLDYDMLNNKRREYFYPSNLSPLWARCYAHETIDIKVLSILAYMKNNNVTMYIGGVPSSLLNTRQQWDLPNSWPPFVHYIIFGLNNTGIPLAQHFAFELASQWVKYNYATFIKDGAMHEKFDATIPGQRGGGGEYEVQDGFGWSNGVVLDIIEKYKNLVNGASLIQCKGVWVFLVIVLYVFKIIE